MAWFYVCEQSETILRRHRTLCERWDCVINAGKIFRKPKTRDEFYFCNVIYHRWYFFYEINVYLHGVTFAWYQKILNCVEQINKNVQIWVITNKRLFEIHIYTHIYKCCINVLLKYIVYLKKKVVLLSK